MKNLSRFEPQIEKHHAYKKKHVVDQLLSLPIEHFQMDMGPSIQICRGLDILLFLMVYARSIHTIIFYP